MGPAIYLLLIFPTSVESLPLCIHAVDVKQPWIAAQQTTVPFVQAVQVEGR